MGGSQSFVISLVNISVELELELEVEGEVFLSVLPTRTLAETDLISQRVIYMKMSFVDADEVRPDPVGISGSNIHQTDDLTMNY